MVDTIDHPLREAVQRRRTLTFLLIYLALQVRWQSVFDFIGSVMEGIGKLLIGCVAVVGVAAILVGIAALFLV